MAGPVRHLLLRQGRYYARIRVPDALRAVIGKQELRAPLDADRTIALRLLPSAVHRMQITLDDARDRLGDLTPTKGDGTGKPKGIMTATGIAEIKTGAAANFPASNPADVIIGMYHSLPTAHAQNGVWLLNRKTLGVIRTWKDSTGRYLVTDPISEGGATTLLGRPIVEAIDMDDIAANAFPILFGDMQGYRIVDRVGLACPSSSIARRRSR